MTKLARSFFIIFILSIPAWSQLLKSERYFFHDELHLLRLHEFIECIKVGQLPCRWSVNTTFGFGQPLFVFYGQTSYFLSSLFYSVGFSYLASFKAVLILSIIVSGFGMYLLARTFWGSNGGVLSAIAYIYGPYRAVNTWVRGAFNECVALAILPFVFHSLFLVVKKPDIKNAIYLGTTIALLVITHNLTLLMVLPFMAAILIACYKSLNLKSLVTAGLVSILLSAFYVFPLIFESKYINLSSIAQNYYNYQLHWASLYQIFISSFWGYGGSTWGPNDTMSFSVGQIHWLFPLLYLFLSRKKSIHFIGFLSLGILALFFIHGKSNFIWSNFNALAYLQFPWRFLSIGLFFLSLSIGKIPSKVILITLLIAANAPFFKAIEWFQYSDNQYFSKENLKIISAYAASDYWTGKSLPSQLSSDAVISISGQKIGERKSSSPSSISFLVNTAIPTTAYFPVAYFPGWKALIMSDIVPVSPSPIFGMIKANLPAGNNIVTLHFTKTPVRLVSELVSLVATCIVCAYIIKPSLFS